MLSQPIQSTTTTQVTNDQLGNATTTTTTVTEEFIPPLVAANNSSELAYASLPPAFVGPVFVPGKTQLIIKPQSAQLVHDVDLIKKMSPHCEIVIGSDVFRTEEAHHMGKLPSWHNSYTHIVQGTENQLQVIVWEGEKEKQRKMIGSAFIGLNDVIAKGSTSYWYDLWYQKGLAGKINIALQVLHIK